MTSKIDDTLSTDDKIGMGILAILIVAVIVGVLFWLTWLGGSAIGVFSPPDSAYQYSEMESAVSQEGVHYKVFYVDDMPCIWVAEFRDGSGEGGISCDWSKFREGF